MACLVIVSHDACLCVCMYLNRSFSNPENEQKEQDASIERLDRELDQTRDNLQKINDRRKIYIYSRPGIVFHGFVFHM